MKRTTIILLSLSLLTIIGKGSDTYPYFFSDPTLSPNGTTIVFSYENDLWKMPSSGGVAYRLTAMEGKERLPRFSPNGKWIAFTASQNGRENIYVMPSEGGEIKQLTFHDANDHVDSWSWDSKQIYFSSDRYNFYSSYQISIEGGTPIRLFDHYFNNPHHIVQHPKTGDFFFTDSWESSTFSHRKRYKGDHSPQILSYNKTTKEFKRHTNYNGKDMWPTIDQQGNLYFVSDEHNNEYNLFKLEGEEKNLLTNFETSINRPQVSANGKYVVFEKDYQIWLFDVDQNTTAKVPVSLISNNTLDLLQSFNIDGKISYFDISPDNKKIAFVSRGVLFVSDTKGKFIKKLETNPNERVFEVNWTSDNQTLIYNQTVNGWANWFTISADGKGTEKQVTFNNQTNRSMTLNSKRSKAVYLCGRNDVKIIDLKTLKSETVVSDELWGFQNSNPRFSPNDEYISFTAYRNFEQDIFIYSIASKQTINLTSTGVTERDPFWSPDGKYIYFTTDRYNPNYPKGTPSSKIYRIPLYKFAKELKSNALSDVFENNATTDTTVSIRIDLKNIIDRWEEVPVSGGRQYSPFLFRQKDETIMLFASSHDKGELALWKTGFKPYEKPKTERLSTFKVNTEFQVALSKDDAYTLVNGTIYKIDNKGNKLEKIEINHSFSKSLRNEMNQMFFETWAIIDENFYDENFHGINWSAKRDYYARFLPHVRHRDNLRRLLNDMLGELNASHMGFRSTGDEEKTFYSTNTASAGLLFSNDNPYMVERILINSNADLTNQEVEPGDILVAVNGKRVDSSINREFYFSFPSIPEELTLTFLRKGKEVTTTKVTHNAREHEEMLYDEWIARNREYVDKKTNGKVAYVYMKDMSERSLNQFIIDMTTYAEKAQALIFDLRYNRGGNVHNDVLQFLAQRPYLNWRYREGALSPQPNFSPSAKPMILVMNEHSLSDAEMTAAGFRHLDLGKLIGTETYRWIIFTSGKGLVDNSFVRIPAWGCYTLNGDNLELTGVAPDIYVRTTFKDRINNIDPQLDMAIEEMMKDIN